MGKRGPEKQFGGRLSIRLPLDLDNKLTAWAKRQGVKRSEAIRRLLAKALK